ncbi:MAG TPA: hypothetical protein VJV23_12945, partial [Candidatus Polarisedimenticolia bacterium]|nr:hypothetical protein [Candidatus Polarisedimenticolia bacterium]
AAAGAAGYFVVYARTYPSASAPAFQFGMKELYDYLESPATQGHDSIYITRNEDLPWVHLLFYRRFPPAEYQRHGLSRTRYLFDQEVFYKGERIPGRRNPVFVWKPWEVPSSGVAPRRVVRYPDGSEAFVVAW